MTRYAAAIVVGLLLGSVIACAALAQSSISAAADKAGVLPEAFDVAWKAISTLIATIGAILAFIGTAVGWLIKQGADRLKSVENKQDQHIATTHDDVPHLADAHFVLAPFITRGGPAEQRFVEGGTGLVVDDPEGDVIEPDGLPARALERCRRRCRR